jgi:hypothetical protein
MFVEVIEAKLAQMETDLAETKNSAAYIRGPVNDAVQIIIPIFEDQVKLMREILELVKEK